MKNLNSKSASFYGLFTLVFSMLTIGAGCGRPFDIPTSSGFVELENQEPDYDYRATTPDGVIVSVRSIDNTSTTGERGDIGFWERAITLEMRDVQGYALLETKDVTSADGTKGRQLKFGHDEDAKPYAYWVTLYLAQSRIFIVEAGGKKDLVERATPNLTWMAQNIHVKCNGLLSPVLESRTCNRW